MPNQQFTTTIAAGGETHQQADESAKPGDGHAFLTTNQGIRVSDNQNQLKAGARGPVLLEDFVLREKITHFDHERIPERIVHARGSGAHGYFECTESMSEITRAGLFQNVGERTPVFVRFSTVLGSRGSKDTPRDVRGFATKFYTKEGVWDLVANNIPVFFIQDALKFPDVVHAGKPEADRQFPEAATAHTTFWDYISLTPESMHMVMWIMSDRTLPRTFRTMEGFGVHTFRFVNEEGKSTFVKFHWKPKQGNASSAWDEAVKIGGADPDFQRRDLWDAIQRGDFPEWEFGVQLFDQKFADSLPFDVLDATKIIPEEVLPVKIIGRMVLDRWPNNFFADTEQVAFCPANIVPGIDFSNDPLLLGRLHSYLDTQLSRLGGPNFHQIPINQPKCPFMNFQRDGHMQMLQHNIKGRASYEPNSLAEGGEITGPRECPRTGFRSHPGRAARDEQGDKLRIRPESFADHYSQARMFFRSLDPLEQMHLASALVFELSCVDMDHIVTRMLGHLVNIDPELAARVAGGIGVPVPDAIPTTAPILDVDLSPAVRIINGPLDFNTLVGRMVGIFIADGTDAKDLEAVKAMVTGAGARPFVVAPRIKGIQLSNGTPVTVEGNILGYPSALFDAVAVVLSPEGCQLLLKEATAVQWVMDAFGHCKCIGATEGAQPLLDKAGVEKDEGVVGLDENFVKAAGTRYWARERKVRPTTYV